MRRIAILVGILSLSLVLVSRAERRKKPPDVQILECKGRRADVRITFDGRVKNTGEKIVHGLILSFDFLSSDQVVLTTLNGPVETEELEPGKESNFHLEADAPPRAVRYQLNAADASGRDLRLGNAGPFAIE